MSSPKRTVLITGCSDGGMGSALALSFHKANWRVLTSARNLTKTTAVSAAGIETLQLDTLSASSIASAVSRVTELTGGTLNCIVHNAGAGFTMPLSDVDVAQAKELFDLNVFSIITVTQAFLPLLRNAAPDALLVIHTSGSSQTAGMLPFAGVYNASKAAAAALAETFRIELAPFGIRTVNLLTGAVSTNFGANRVVNPTLPADSMYAIAREEAQVVMDNTCVPDASDAAQWAEQVVADLSRRKPAYWIWRGKLVTPVWLAGFLPVGALDFVMGGITGLSAMEKRIREVLRGEKDKAV
ncbi:hypothetical protein B0T16DRAFT_170786 [Cercophora newfieldiana]|uniref:Uncharacterized protein n=1 Tax=Cercophora newfieldiana TaxID=92897 RepID=A0AA39Y6E4_9PEZI|nr:hypothetical protein B0T16DRAFT_170786 [Cercophora newfieldiana]